MINPALRAYLAANVLTRGDGAFRSDRNCKLCGGPARFFDAVDFNKSCDHGAWAPSAIMVEYFRCQRCELLFTDFCDQWSHADFARFVYNDEYVAVDPDYASVRPLRAARELAPSLAGGERLRILDYGSGGCGFEAALRARGFDRIESYDPFSRPERPNGRFDLITCLDVIEHSPDPRAILAEIRSFLAEDGCVLVGQTLQPADIQLQRGDWWYVAPRNGHVTTYSCETMRLYAEDNGLTFFDFGDLFALTGPAPSIFTQKIVARRRPQVRRIALAAPPPDAAVHTVWHSAEVAPSGPFRWTREPEIRFGAHPTSRGQLRVVMRHFGSRDPDFLARSRIRVGAEEARISVHEDDLFAMFDLPSDAVREISLLTPVPYSEAAAGLGTDLRAVGLAISCDLPAVR